MKNYSNLLRINEIIFFKKIHYDELFFHIFFDLLN